MANLFAGQLKVATQENTSLEEWLAFDYAPIEGEIPTQNGDISPSQPATSGARPGQGSDVGILSDNDDSTPKGMSHQKEKEGRRRDEGEVKEDREVDDVNITSESNSNHSDDDDAPLMKMKAQTWDQTCHFIDGDVPFSPLAKPSSNHPQTILKPFTRGRVQSKYGDV